ncbi:hypothetical protein Scep_027838 [Stephania cephalantha]|uniref:Uncharacterized protein n=1 Tax=Stephania cephalantha TaxID=152367 RepID=A0AAP0HLH7_9MAGN
MTDPREASSAGWRRGLTGGKATSSAESRQFAPVGEDHQRSRSEQRTPGRGDSRAAGRRGRQRVGGGGGSALNHKERRPRVNVPTTGGIQTTGLRLSLAYLDELNLGNKGSARKFCFQNALLIFSTASSSYRLHTVDMDLLNLVVIDEAAMLKECESTIPLQLNGMRHAFLIGDECQLPAMVSSKISCQAGFGRSLFERMGIEGRLKHLLDMQYRMHPKISRFPNAKFFNNMIHDASNVRKKNYTRKFLSGPMFGPYSFINIADGREEVGDIGHSYRNMVEVALVMKIVREVFMVIGFYMRFEDDSLESARTDKAAALEVGKFCQKLIELNLL